MQAEMQAEMQAINLTPLFRLDKRDLEVHTSF